MNAFALVVHGDVLAHDPYTVPPGVFLITFGILDKPMKKTQVINNTMIPLFKNHGLPTLFDNNNTTGFRTDRGNKINAQLYAEDTSADIRMHMPGSKTTNMGITQFENGKLDPLTYVGVGTIDALTEQSLTVPPATETTLGDYIHAHGPGVYMIIACRGIVPRPELVNFEKYFIQLTQKPDRTPEDDYVIEYIPGLNTGENLITSFPSPFNTLEFVTLFKKAVLDAHLVIDGDSISTEQIIRIMDNFGLKDNEKMARQSSSETNKRHKHIVDLVTSICILLYNTDAHVREAEQAYYRFESESESKNQIEVLEQMKLFVIRSNLLTKDDGQLYVNRTAFLVEIKKVAFKTLLPLFQYKGTYNKKNHISTTFNEICQFLFNPSTEAQCDKFKHDYAIYVQDYNHTHDYLDTPVLLSKLYLMLKRIRTLKDGKEDARNKAADKWKVDVSKSDINPLKTLLDNFISGIYVKNDAYAPLVTLRLIPAGGGTRKHSKHKYSKHRYSKHRYSKKRR